jgi:protein-S-isoprenylcysteine O-methyltransferase Ste14
MSIMSVIIYLSFVFGLSELVLVFFKRSKSGIVKTRSDKGSLILLWFIMISCITAGFFNAKYSQWDPINCTIALAGIILYIIGLIIRWLSIMQLKRRFTVNVAINRDHVLETGGLYKYVRHPSYLGLMLILTGLSLAMNSMISFMIVIFPVFLGLNYRIFVEERLLEDEFGEEYVNFRATRKKIIPFIW